MSQAAIDAVIDAAEAVRSALDSDDPAAIEAATTTLGKSLVPLQQGGWRAEPDQKAQLQAILPILEAARIRTQVLADLASQRLTLLSDRGCTRAPLTYGR